MLWRWFLTVCSLMKSFPPFPCSGSPGQPVERCLQNHPARTQTHGADDVAVIFGGGQNDDAGGQRVKVDFLQHSQATLSGMRRSSSKMSGLSLASILMQSAPFEASPIMEISSAELSSLRKPSRKMAWSSASRVRMACLLEGIPIKLRSDNRLVKFCQTPGHRGI